MESFLQLKYFPWEQNVSHICKRANEPVTHAEDADCSRRRHAWCQVSASEVSTEHPSLLYSDYWQIQRATIILFAGLACVAKQTSIILFRYKKNVLQNRMLWSAKQMHGPKDCSHKCIPQKVISTVHISGSKELSNAKPPFCCMTVCWRISILAASLAYNATRCTLKCSSLSRSFVTRKSFHMSLDVWLWIRGQLKRCELRRAVSQCGLSKGGLGVRNPWSLSQYRSSMGSR